MIPSRRSPSVPAATRRVAVATGLALLHSVLPLGAQETVPWPGPTRAEASGWIETSRYADVVTFLEALDERYPQAHLETMGYTSEGRAIPLLVVGDVPDGSPEAVRASARLRVYLQGNIHAGEVPGKEALQMLARDLLAEGAERWMDDLVLLIAPIYNADGNERVSLLNRPRQHGPIGGMGQRPNAQGLDLNRDHMKLDSPEARSVVGMMNRYDPEVSVDLHTTNGSRHAYHLTYAPPLHPGTDPGIDALLREVAFPRITERVLEEDGEAFWYYGNVSNRSGEPGWWTFDHRPRFNNNYIGLRNRVAILSEAYAYATFEQRTRSTYRFVEEILDWAADEPDRIREVIAGAERSVRGERLPLRARHRGADSLSTILMGAVAEEPHPYTGRTMLRRVQTVRPEAMREFGSFQGTVVGRVPAGWVVPAEVDVAVDRLRAHGLRMEWLEPGSSVAAERFAIDSVRSSGREFQGHVEQELLGSWAGPDTVTLEEGAWLVPTDQPLGRLAFYLLDPRSDDGLANWALLGEPGERWPILRLQEWPTSGGGG